MIFHVGILLHTARLQLFHFFLMRASIAEAFLRITLLFLLFLLLTNFYQIFKESCHFENPVETCRKLKFVVGAE